MLVTQMNRDVVFLILQYLDEVNLKESMHKLEQESGFFFNMKYFEEKVMAGDWGEVNCYLSGFTKMDDNKNSLKMFFLLEKQKFLEALDRCDKVKATEILVNDLKAFSVLNQDLFNELSQLLTLDNFREKPELSNYGDTKSARSMMLIELKKLIGKNPRFRFKQLIPSIKPSRMETLINQSLNWQHHLCRNPHPSPSFRTLFVDHCCPDAMDHNASTVSHQHATVPRASVSYTQPAAHSPFNPAAASVNPNDAGCMPNGVALWSNEVVVVAPSSVTVPPNQARYFKRQRTPPDASGVLEHQINDQDRAMKHLRPSRHHVDEVSLSTPFPQVASLLQDLPIKVACTFNQGSYVTSMDFHPSLHTILLVGSSNGEVTLWDIRLHEMLVSKQFTIWKINTCTPQFQAALRNEGSISINKVTWSPEGNFIGIAFTKHLIQLYIYQARNDIDQLLEIDAHVGGVNDIAFCRLFKHLCVVTCGDDKLIKVWDLRGQKHYVFEGHEAPVYSICPHQNGNRQFIISTSLDGKIKIWLYDNMGSKVDFYSPGHGCTKMLYGADGKRLFSCGTSKEGQSFLVEWNLTEVSIKRTYFGFLNKSSGVVQIDTAKNKFLAAGEDNRIKFWNVDDPTMLTSTDAEGGLPNVPCLRFNKRGNLLAVNMGDKGFKILANADGLKTLRTFETSSFEQVGSGYEASPLKNRSNRIPDKDESFELAQILDPQQCRVVTITESIGRATKVAGLLYTNSGDGLLALWSNGRQCLWKWSPSEQNPSGKATTNVVPQHWKPNSGLLMTNDIPDTDTEEAVPCIVLSKNDSYIISACGGKVSLFSMMSFEMMTTLMSAPPTSTFLAFNPEDNNVIAVGMNDSTILIYNVKMDEVKTRLKGHGKHITGLAFSNNLRILISSGADAQLCIWSTDTWEKKKSVSILLPAGQPPAGVTRVQMSCNESRLLIVHETQIAIYDVPNLDQIQQWFPKETLSAPISYATYSCNCKVVYACFCDGNIGVFDARNLRLICRIAPTSYLSPAVATSNPLVYPLVLAAHPQKPNQFAAGLTDGSVKVIEPVKS